MQDIKIADDIIVLDPEDAAIATVSTTRVTREEGVTEDEIATEPKKVGEEANDV